MSALKPFRACRGQEIHDRVIKSKLNPNDVDKIVAIPYARLLMAFVNPVAPSGRQRAYPFVSPA